MIVDKLCMYCNSYSLTQAFVYFCCCCCLLLFFTLSHVYVFFVVFNLVFSLFLFVCLLVFFCTFVCLGVCLFWFVLTVVCFPYSPLLSHFVCFNFFVWCDLVVVFLFVFFFIFIFLWFFLCAFGVLLLCFVLDFNVFRNLPSSVILFWLLISLQYLILWWWLTHVLSNIAHLCYRTHLFSDKRIIISSTHQSPIILFW